MWHGLTFPWDGDNRHSILKLIGIKDQDYIQHLAFLTVHTEMSTEACGLLQTKMRYYWLEVVTCRVVRIG